MTALAVVVVLFCLNLWGLFEIPLPVFVARAAGSGPREGVPGHFVSGLFATLMATPCSAPFLGTALGFALAQPAGVIVAVFTAVGFGMALPYLVLAAAPRLAGLLPRPGAWMETLKIVMGFLLAGAAIWLFYVLSAQVSAERVAFIELALLSLALGVWLRSRLRRPTGRRVAVALAMAAGVTSVVLAWGAEVRPSGAARAVSGDEGGRISWIAFDEARARKLAAGGTAVFVDVTADWCFTCKVNEKLALDTPEVAAAFERHGVVTMKADWTNRDDSIAAYLASFGRYGIPFYVLYRPGEEPHLFGELLTAGRSCGCSTGPGHRPASPLASSRATSSKNARNAGEYQASAGRSVGTRRRHSATSATAASRSSSLASGLRRQRDQWAAARSRAAWPRVRLPRQEAFSRSSTARA